MFPLCVSVFVDVWLQSGHVEFGLYVGKHDLQKGALLPWSWQLWPGMCMCHWSAFIFQKINPLQRACVMTLNIWDTLVAFLDFMWFFCLGFSAVGENSQSSGHWRFVWLHWQVQHWAGTSLQWHPGKVRNYPLNDSGRPSLANLFRLICRLLSLLCSNISLIYDNICTHSISLLAEIWSHLWLLSFTHALSKKFRNPSVIYLIHYIRLADISYIIQL